MSDTPLPMPAALGMDTCRTTTREHPLWTDWMRRVGSVTAQRALCCLPSAQSVKLQLPTGVPGCIIHSLCCLHCLLSNPCHPCFLHPSNELLLLESVSQDLLLRKDTNRKKFKKLCLGGPSKLFLHFKSTQDLHGTWVKRPTWAQGISHGS